MDIFVTQGSLLQSLNSMIFSYVILVHIEMHMHLVYIPQGQ